MIENSIDQLLLFSRGYESTTTATTKTPTTASTKGYGVELTYWTAFYISDTHSCFLSKGRYYGFLIGDFSRETEEEIQIVEREK